MRLRLRRGARQSAGCLLLVACLSCAGCGGGPPDWEAVEAQRFVERVLVQGPAPGRPHYARAGTAVVMADERDGRVTLSYNGEPYGTYAGTHSLYGLGGLSCFSPDGSRFACFVRDGGDWPVILREPSGEVRRLPGFEKPVGYSDRPLFGSDGRLAYRTVKEGRHHIVCGERVSPPFLLGKVSYPRFSRDGRICYSGKTPEGAFCFVEEARYGPYEEADLIAATLSWEDARFEANGFVVKTPEGWHWLGLDGALGETLESWGPTAASTVTHPTRKYAHLYAVQAGKHRDLVEGQVGAELRHLRVTARSLAPGKITVLRVESGRDAAQAGIRADDVLLELNGLPLADLAVFNRELESLGARAKGGESVGAALTLERDGERVVVSLPLGKSYYSLGWSCEHRRHESRMLYERGEWHVVEPDPGATPVARWEPRGVLADGRVVSVVTKGGQDRLLVGDRFGPSFERVASVKLSEDGKHWAAVAQRSGSRGWILLHDDREQELPAKTTDASVYLTPDGSRAAACVSLPNNRRSVVVDGKASPPWEGVYWTFASAKILASRSGRFVYFGVRDKRTHLVVDGQPVESFDDVDRQGWVVDATGRRIAFGARRGDTILWAVREIP